MQPRSLHGRTGTKGHGPVRWRMSSSFSCPSRWRHFSTARSEWMCLQRVGGVDAEMLFGLGKRLGDSVQHGGRADSGQGLGTLLVEQVAAVFSEFGDNQRNRGLQVGLPSQPHHQRFQPLHGVVVVVLNLLRQEGTDLLFAFLAVASQGLHDAVGVAEVDFVGVLLVLAFLAELFQLPPAGGLIPGEHPQPFGERRYAGRGGSGGPPGWRIPWAEAGRGRLPPGPSTSCKRSSRTWSVASSFSSSMTQAMVSSVCGKSPGRPDQPVGVVLPAVSLHGLDDQRHEGGVGEKTTWRSNMPPDPEVQCQGWRMASLILSSGYRTAADPSVRVSGKTGGACHNRGNLSWGRWPPADLDPERASRDQFWPIDCVLRGSLYLIDTRLAGESRLTGPAFFGSDV